MSKSHETNRDLWKQVYKMYLIDRMPLAAIAEAIGKSPSYADQLRRRFGLPSKQRADLYHPAASQMFSAEQEQILLGSLLGDGCIVSRTSRNPVYKETHSIHQLAYIEWKASKLKPFVKDVRIGHKGTQAYITSVALPQLKFYYNVFYHKKKRIPVEALHWLDDLAVAVWYMDDGSISRNSKQVRIATHGFGLAETRMLQGWMAAKYGIDFYVYESGGYPVMTLQKRHNSQFLNLVGPHIVSSMRYKLG